MDAWVHGYIRTWEDLEGGKKTLNCRKKNFEKRASRLRQTHARLLRTSAGAGVGSWSQRLDPPKTTDDYCFFRVSALTGCVCPAARPMRWELRRWGGPRTMGIGLPTVPSNCSLGEPGIKVGSVPDSRRPLTVDR